MNITTVLNIIAAMASSGVKSLADHAKTLVGPRTRGSTTEAGLETLDGNLEGTEITPVVGAIPGCRYVQFQAPAMGCKLGAVTLSTALREGWDVRVRRGSHGLELFRDVSPETVEMPEADFVTVILGPDETGTLPEVIWTWHPGPPMASLRDPLGDFTAVKVHNG